MDTGDDTSPFNSPFDSPLYSASPSYFASFLPYFSRQPELNPSTNNNTEPTTNPLPRGTLLHKGFYDLLTAIPSASPSRLWRPAATQQQPDPLLAGPRYDQLPQPSNPPVTVARAPPQRKNRRISKDMVSKPTGFVHLVHASDADQAEAILRRWGPDGIGKLGDPRWAAPIKDIIRRQRAVADVVTALKPSRIENPPPLRVINGMSAVTVSSTGATINHGSIPTTTMDGLPPASRPSALRWELPPHPEEHQSPPSQPHAEFQFQSQLEQFQFQSPPQPQPSPSPRPLPALPRKDITPSLTTLEKAIAARIYFENLYFPLLRHRAPREQRRLAMERDMAQMSISEAAREELRERWRRNETEYLRERRRRVGPSAFVKLKTIGHGAFGVVSLVRETTSGQLFAMKQLRKIDMLRKGQEGHVRAERDVLKSAAQVGGSGSDWIVKMFYSFQDREHLYLVLEFMGGGDLLNLLIEKDVFEEDFARFYVAEMILAIEQCHKHGFIHRDIKPDNFLFDPDGHIKLSDFGLATDLHWAHDTSYYEQQRKDLLKKHGIDLEDGTGDLTKTRRMDRKEVERIMGGGEGEGGIFTWREKNRKKASAGWRCGTNSYMSPEVIRGHGYSFSCDWWSLGVIMYECLYGYPPFVSNSRHVTRQKILNWKQSLRFPSRPHVSLAGVNLMEQLLCEPEDRLGSQASTSVSRADSLIIQTRRSGFVNSFGGKGSIDGAELIKAHSWFSGIDWDHIRKYPAPFRPELQHPEDTRHFDGDIPAEPLAPANGAAADATRDPLLRDKTHGAHILEVRKALAFAGFTHKSPRAISYAPLGQLYPDNDASARDRGRNTVREVRRNTMQRGRAISM
ncbi:kinase-like domain-containing protein [Hysterangium stoloniferum]|nr:kinase-like domain-containing protein [Hysterangium stoloniferum]